MLVGRVISITGLIGKAEFRPHVKEGDFVYYKTATDSTVMCQISKLVSTPHKGIHGSFQILEDAELPKVWDHLYALHQRIEGHINIGVTHKGEPVKFRVNPFFRHVLLGGKTSKGKTHTEIVMLEEFLKLKIPAIVIDTQGELIHLNMFNSAAVVVEEMRFDDLVSHLQFKKSVIYNFQGLSYSSKAQRCFEILSQLREAKEKDYKQAESDVKLLQIPPVIVVIDETEIYAPEPRARCSSKDSRDCLVDIAKRGGKLGIGLVVSSQRLPGLHYDVRSQCNSAMIFQITDTGSRMVLSQLPYITSFDLRRIKNLERGECIVTGEVVPHPVTVLVRDIETPRARNVDFEEMLGLTPTPVEKPKLAHDDSELREFQDIMDKGVTFEQLQSQFSSRKIPRHGQCLVVPQRYFKPGWKNTLEIQGCKVIYCPEMPGGSVYLIRKNNKKEILQKVKQMAREHLPRDTSKLPY